DLLLAEHGGERVAARVAGALARIAADLHGLRELCDRQLHLAPVPAGPHADIADVRGLEARRLDMDGVAPRLKRVEGGVAARAGLERRVPHADGGADN